MSDILLIRHGQASFGAQDYDNLSPLGRQQCAWLGQHLADIDYRPDHVISGGLKRHAQSLAEVSKALELPEAQEITHFEEFDFHSIMDGYARLAGPQPAMSGDPALSFDAWRCALLAWARDEIDAAESFSDYKARVALGLEQVVALEGHVLIMTSGGSVAAVTALMLRLDPAAHVTMALKLKNASMTRLIRRSYGTELYNFNTAPHLEAPERMSAITYV
jgi:broad specificity phosphatase PhoE